MPATAATADAADAADVAVPLPILWRANGIDSVNVDTSINRSEEKAYKCQMC